MRTETIPMEQLSELLMVQLERGVAPLRVTGISMHPTFRNGKDTVFLQRPATALRRGDVILYRRENGQYVLHRIVRLKDGLLILSGDNQHEPEPVEQSQVIARVESFRRKGRVYAASHLGYRVWVWLWVALFPVRKPILTLRRGIGKIRRRLMKR